LCICADWDSTPLTGFIFVIILISSRLDCKQTSEEMVFQPRCCPYCQQAFQPSPRRPDQAVCSRPECQARRRSDYRRRKRQADSEYADVVRDSRRKWREAHPGYQKNYWRNHPEAAARNRQQQRQRDQKRRVRLLVKNTLVVDLKRSAAEVWLVGPLAQDLVKNTLVSSKLLILQSPPAATPSSATS
jgi:hypothetical protein